MGSKNFIVKEISTKNKLRPDSEGVFYCEQCEKVVGQYSSSRIKSRAEQQVAETHTEVTGHCLERVSRHGPSTRININDNLLNLPVVD